MGSPIFSIRNVFNPVLKIYDIEGNKLFSSRLKDKDGIFVVVAALCLVNLILHFIYHIFLLNVLFFISGNVNLNFTKKKESYIFSEVLNFFLTLSSMVSYIRLFCTQVLEGVEFEGDVKISIIHDGMTGDKKLFHFYINCTTETGFLLLVYYYC